ncbi:hypothetical protein [Chitinophaga eiseniae]|uniref:Uncharacterized protein n=1 Tax=Chitinophaga eiseniae TaxID=634771 RepID=A0A847SKF7_9BACT|nr:hypothetical protein [Chitinophaga eiseniae]NLR78018.1 hypothetical protein [Chitinophaga eiseniae]
MENRVLQAYNRWNRKEEEFMHRYGRSITNSLDFQKLKWRVYNHIISQSKRVSLSSDERDELSMVKIKADALIRAINGGRDLSYMQKIGFKISDILHPGNRYRNMKDVFLEFTNSNLTVPSASEEIKPREYLGKSNPVFDEKRLFKINRQKIDVNNLPQNVLDDNATSRTRLFKIQKKEMHVHNSDLRAVYVRQEIKNKVQIPAADVTNDKNIIKLKKRKTAKPISNDKLIVSVKL